MKFLRKLKHKFNSVRHLVRILIGAFWYFTSVFVSPCFPKFTKISIWNRNMPCIFVIFCVCNQKLFWSKVSSKVYNFLIFSWERPYKFWPEMFNSNLLSLTRCISPSNRRRDILNISTSRLRWAEWNLNPNSLKISEIVPITYFSKGFVIWQVI